ncbi:hypothetical protein B0T13DRAFT_449049 [Neurospora crassa]|nr:hypothetical protein B0T13DRAFT_449049 [Neurospora crassa]
MAMSQETLELSILELHCRDDGEESASGQMGYRGSDNRASPALFASRKLRRHMCVLRAIGDPVIGHGSGSIEKKVGSCVARPKVCFGFRRINIIYCRITSCATIQIQLSKVTSSTPTTASLAPNCKYPARHQGLDAKIDSQLNCGGKIEGLTVRCDCPPSML